MKAIQKMLIVIAVLLFLGGNYGTANPTSNGNSEMGSEQGLGKEKRFSGQKVIARVNGIEIKGNHLVPLGKEAKLPENAYEFRLHRAIESELAFQDAQSANIELTEIHRQRLEKLRESREYDDAVVDPIGNQEATIDLEIRQAQAFLLEKMLLEKEGVPLPYVSEDQVEAYYAAHMADYDALPEEPEARQVAWQTIDFDIRLKLTDIQRAEYQKQREAFYDRLKDQADIEVSLSSEPEE